MKQKLEPATHLELLVLGRAQRGLGPSASQRRLTLDRLVTALESLPPPPLDDRSTPETSPPEAPIAHEPPGSSTTGASGVVQAASSSGRFSLHAMVAGVLAGAAVGFGAGVIASSADAPSAAPPAAATRSVPAPRLPDVTAHVETQPVDALTPLAPNPSAYPVRRRPARTQPSAERERHEPLAPPSASSGPAEATFYEELSYVRRAQSALQQGNATLALGLMQSLDEIQASGALMAERSMTRVLALCELDRTAEATEVARSMLSGDHAADVYRRRLAGSCAGAGLAQALEHEPVVKDSAE